MRHVSSTWAVILAGGDGSRLRDITRTAAGEVVPKQFCSLLRKTCLLEDAIRRAQAVASARHICSVVAEQHRRWWSGALDRVPEHNIFTQPKNRGTAHGILWALLQIERRAPNSVVVLLPADHYLGDETTMARSLEPPRRRIKRAAVRRKPSAEQARELVRTGALWNTFIFAGSVRALVGLFEGPFAATVKAMRQAPDLAQSERIGPAAMELLYAELESGDFSRESWSPTSICYRYCACRAAVGLIWELRSGSRKRYAVSPKCDHA